MGVNDVGVNDAREQLEVCKSEYAELEYNHGRALAAIEKIEMYIEENPNSPVFLDYIDRTIAEFWKEIK